MAPVSDLIVPVGTRRQSYRTRQLGDSASQHLSAILQPQSAILQCQLSPVSDLTALVNEVLAPASDLTAPGGEVIMSVSI